MSPFPTLPGQICFPWCHCCWWNGASLVSNYFVVHKTLPGGWSFGRPECEPPGAIIALPHCLVPGGEGVEGGCWSGPCCYLASSVRVARASCCCYCGSSSAWMIAARPPVPLVPPGVRELFFFFLLRKCPYVSALRQVQSFVKLCIKSWSNKLIGVTNYYSFDLATINLWVKLNIFLFVCCFLTDHSRCLPGDRAGIRLRGLEVPEEEPALDPADFLTRPPSAPLYGWACHSSSSADHRRNTWPVPMCSKALSSIPGHMRSTLKRQLELGNLFGQELVVWLHYSSSCMDYK